MKNKKIIIAVIIFVVVIVIAIAAFFLIKSLNDSGNKNSQITFSGEEQNTSNDNTTSEDPDEVEYDDDIPDYAKKIADQFVAAYMDSDEMQKFINDYLDTKAYVAYEKIEGDDTKFMDAYATVTDEEAKEIEDSFMAVPSIYQLMANMSDLSNMTMNVTEDSDDENATENATENETENTSENETKNTTNESSSESSEGTEIKLKKVTNYQQSSDVEEITSVDLTLSFLGEDAKLTIYFYNEIVIYIEAEDGSSIVDEDTMGGDTDGNQVDQNTVENDTDEEN